MLSCNDDIRRAPFPAIPLSLRQSYQPEELRLRQFGVCANDLEVNFQTTARPQLITQLLQLCTECSVSPSFLLPTEDFYWALSLGKRIEALLTIASATQEGRLILLQRCTSESCRESFEFEIMPTDLERWQASSSDSDAVSVTIGAEVITLRIPTGNDQLLWLGAAYEDANSAAKALIEILRRSESNSAGFNPEIPDHWIAPLSAALDEADPLVNATLRAICPQCQTENRISLDLERLALNLLRDQQIQLLREVHRLADRYHWSEEQICKMPIWRRQHYLALIEAERSA